MTPDLCSYSTLKEKDPNSPLLKYKLHIVTSFQIIHMECGESNFIVGDLTEYFSQVIKVNINIYKSC